MPSIHLDGFAASEEAMIVQAVAALQGVGYDAALMKELVRADLPAGHAAMTLFGIRGAVLGAEAFSSQAMLNHVLEEELEEAAHAIRKFHRPA